MRNFSKKLAFVLAAAMVFTAFAPAAKADAAEKMTMNRASQTLYVNEGVNDKGAETLPEGLYGNVQTYDFWVKNKPANYAKELNFKWASDNEKVATVDQKGLTTAVAVGTANITCTITDKAAKVDPVVVTAKVTVKANAADVVISNADEYEDFVVADERVIDLNRDMYDEDGNKTNKRGKFVTDYTKWVAKFDGEEVANTVVAVDQATGKFTFAADAPAGEYELSCYTYQSDKYNQVTAESDPVVVTVEDVKNAFEAEQKSLDTFDVVFDKAVESLGKTDFTIKKVRVNAATGKEYTSVVSVKGVALDATKTKATVTIFGSFADATNYNISLKGFEDTFVMTAHAGLPVRVEVFAVVNNVEVGDVIVKGQEGILKTRFFDANDIDVTKAGYVPNYSLAEYSKTGAYTLSTKSDGTKYLTFKKTDEFAPVNVKYQKREGSKVVVDINETFYFGAEEPTPVYVTGLAGYSLNNFDPNYNQQSLQLKEKDRYLKVKISTDNPAEKDPTLIDLSVVGKDKVDAEGTPKFSFKAINPDICNITDAGLLVPYKADTAAFYVCMAVLGANKQYGEAEPIDVIYIEVMENSKFNNFTFDKYDVTVGDVSGYDEAKITATLVDQYGVEYDGGKALKIEGVTDNAKYALSAKDDEGKNKFTLTTSGAGKKQTITIKGSALAAAVADNNEYKIAPGSAATFEFKATDTNNSYGNVVQHFTVTVMTKGDSSADYIAVENNGTTSALRVVDGKDGDDGEKIKFLTFSVFTMNNGVKVAPKSFTACPTKEADIAAVSAGSYFYKVTKNGNPINGAFVDDSTRTSVTIKLSGENPVASGSAIGTAKVVNYNDTGAGEYTFELFYSWYDGQITSMETNTVVVEAGDAGAYTLVSQESDSVKVTDYIMKDNEVSSNETDKDAILKCFKFTGRDGKDVDLTKKTVDVKYDATAGTGTVYVESITVYEKVVDDYVAYVIPVNVVLTRLTK